MILQPCHLEEPQLVKLTKIHYYDSNKKGQNLASVPTISAASSNREVCDNNHNRNVIIKRNIFGQRWVLKINEGIGGVEKTTKKRKKCKVVVYVLVFCSIVVAVAFGVFFSIEKHFANYSNKSMELPDVWRNFSNNQEKQSSEFDRNTTTNSRNKWTNTDSNKSHSDLKYPFCTVCKSNEVCMKLHVTDIPKCLPALNINDPTGCGGHCKINIQYCQRLDKNIKVYQCSHAKHTLKCPDRTFNCGNMCIADNKRCDGFIDCSNRSDEENCECNLETHFHCANSTSCLIKSKRCDRKIDCWDKSDEENCKPDVSCIQDQQLPCNDGHCIAIDNFCDGKFDCHDHSDEPDGCQRF